MELSKKVESSISLYGNRESEVLQSKNRQAERNGEVSKMEGKESIPLYPNYPVAIQSLL